MQKKLFTALRLKLFKTIIQKSLPWKPQPSYIYTKHDICWSWFAAVKEFFALYVNIYKCVL
jgi:hypothetical protein